ncbi:hypothetical protein QAD02_020813 [Eretmocerus hayati]|uniref:Uncharacterized protein n=1 Tax=Eretmocerus hayati TaxID=131215 RepID=A0ACC2PT97_9HYME|nr:hypothetical protein QAD02_020813 [Eretmocerus hayati]
MAGKKGRAQELDEAAWTGYTPLRDPVTDKVYKAHCDTCSHAFSKRDHAFLETHRVACDAAHKVSCAESTKDTSGTGSEKLQLSSSSPVAIIPENRSPNLVHEEPLQHTTSRSTGSTTGPKMNALQAFSLSRRSFTNGTEFLSVERNLHSASSSVCQQSIGTKRVKSDSGKKLCEPSVEMTSVKSNSEKFSESVDVLFLELLVRFGIDFNQANSVHMTKFVKALNKGYQIPSQDDLQNNLLR